MFRRNALIVFAFLALAAIFFAPVVFGGAVLVPFDNLFRFPPWSAYAAQFGVQPPHNELVSDLVLENYAWKKLIVQSLQAHEIPLWNPYLFAGVPFLAAGQNSALYPFSILFYILPIDRAYGYFSALQIAIAALTMFAFMRVLGLRRFSASISAITYAFSGFMIVSTTFPMIISAAAWLPAVLACVELMVRSKDLPRKILFTLIGAIVLGIQFLAGHVEISIYILIVTAFYSLWRILTAFPPRSFFSFRARSSATGVDRQGRTGPLGLLLLVAFMTGLGITLGAVQLIPLYELVQSNFRSGSVTYQDVIGWSYPVRQIITFFIPDFFGNPTSHAYFDIFDFTNHAAPFETIFWGIKNYVEAGAYLGILPLLLAVVAVLARFSRRKSETPEGERKPLPVLLFAALAVLALLFTFGTPLYAFLFYFFPGFDQLHSTFRWVFPFTLSIAALAGMGAEVLENRDWRPEIGKRDLQSLISNLVLFPGVLVLLALAASWLLRDQTLALTDRLVRSSSSAQLAFDSGRMFYSYEFRNVALFALWLVGAGLVLRASRSTMRVRGVPIWQPLALAVIVADLFVCGFDFYPRADPNLAAFTPPAVKFLQHDPSLYRITSYDARGDAGEKVFNPNAGMLYDISDIRGYDSIIPKQYADLMGELAPQDELLNNRIAPFYSPDPLSSPIVNLLNVKYVLTKRPVPNAGYTLVYDGEIRIYRNDRVLPRAFMVPQARVIPDRAALLAEMDRFDPGQQVLLDQSPVTDTTTTCPLRPVTIEQYSGSQVSVRSRQDCAGWLVLSDSYFPGWLAYTDEQETPLYRADYNFRAVFVPAGDHTIRFKYSPLSFRVGIISSFLGAMLVLLGFAYLAWQRLYRVEQSSAVQTVAKNSLLPMASSLLMKLIDLAFALLSLRILGPTGTGRYGWAVAVWFLANTITDFGLGILVTREVSRDRTQANRYLTNTAILRIALWIASLIPIGILAAVYVGFFNLTLDTAWALGLLMLGMLPSTLSASLAFLFNAYEKFEYRIAVDFVTRLLSVALGVIALVLGYSYLGLATVSIFTNLFTLVVFYYLVRTTLFTPRWEPDRALMRWMFSESYPLMLNNLLSGLFFRIDVFILQPLKGDTVLGYYQTAYKFIDALNFIPSNFTLAIFPTLSRYAVNAKDAMLRAYILSLKLLLWIALPITVGTLFVSRELIGILGGSAYLPDSAIALKFLIWFLPFSFINSVTHYVLIALGQQRFLTKAFIVGVVFNVAANLVAIPPLGYVGAALVTVFSEIVLLIPFYYSIRQNLASIPFWSIAWRPALAASVMGLALWALVERAGLLIAVPVAGILYVALLIALGALGEDERALLRSLIPARWHRVARIAE